MLFLVGSLVIIGSIITGFLMEGGSIVALAQPYALLIILGTAFGVLILSSPKSELKNMWKAVKKIMNGHQHERQDYRDLLGFMYYFFRYAKTNSLHDVENHIENPYKSTLFQEFPSLYKSREAVVFFCDYMRMIITGYDNPFELENLADQQIYVAKTNNNELTSALYKLADATPAIGILAAVLGVINAMSSIDQDAAVLGPKIASALLGTFIGVAISYCIIAPLASYIEKFYNNEYKFMECMKAGFVAYARGNPPSICIEFARQVIPNHLKPSFVELERVIENLKVTKRKRVNNGRRESTAAA